MEEEEQEGEGEAGAAEEASGGGWPKTNSTGSNREIVVYYFI